MLVEWSKLSKIPSKSRPSVVITRTRARIVSKGIGKGQINHHIHPRYSFSEDMSIKTP